MSGSLRQLLRRVAAIAMVAMVSEASAATSEHEDFFPDSDFGDSFATRTPIPDGVLHLFGELGESYPEIDVDFFAFRDFVPGSLFSLLFYSASGDTGGSSVFQVFDGLENVLSGEIGVGDFNTGVFEGLVPLSGDVVVKARLGPRPASYYIVDPHADRIVVPEPSTALLIGAGLAALAQRRRRA